MLVDGVAGRIVSLHEEFQLFVPLGPSHLQFPKGQHTHPDIQFPCVQ